jgi:hypothetical protein
MRILSEEQAELADPDQIHEVSVSLLHPNPDNNKVYDPQLASNPDFQLLCETMREVGYNEEPITIATDCEIISGHRRWSAARQIGMPLLRCVVDRTAKSPEIRKLKLIIHNMHRRKSRVELAREIIFWEEAIDAFWRNDPNSVRIAPREVAERLSRITPEEREFLEKIISQHVVSEAEDDNDIDIASLKRNHVNSATQVALRFLGQSKNTQVAKLKSILQVADTLRSNGASDVASEIENLVNKDEINRAMAMAKNYIPAKEPRKRLPPIKSPTDPKRPFQNRTILGCRNSFSQIRQILGTHKLWLRCAESYKCISNIQELLTKVELLEDQHARKMKNAEAVSRPTLVREGEDIPEIQAVQPTPKNSPDEIESLLKAFA